MAQRIEGEARFAAERLAPLTITPRLLESPFSWSETGRPITLRQFIGSKSPEVASRFGIERFDEPVRSVVDLQDDEFSKLVETRMQGGVDKGLTVQRGDTSYSWQELVEAVHSGRAGWVVEAEKRSIRTMEILIEEGKVQLGEDNPNSGWPAKRPPYIK